MTRTMDQFERIQVESPDKSEFFRQFKRMPEILRLDKGQFYGAI